MFFKNIILKLKYRKNMKGLKYSVLKDGTLKITRCVNHKKAASYGILRIDNAVSVIGVGAFSNIYPISKLITSDSLKIIEANAFNGCGNLKEIQLKANIISIGSQAFMSCPIKKVSLPNSIESLGYGVFAKCSKLESVILHGNLKEIGNDLFADCISLNKVQLPSKLNFLGKYMFFNCSKLKEISLPSDLNKMGEGVFEGCASLKRICFPNSLTEISQSAFSKCTSLDTITIPATLKKVCRSAFAGCTNLVQIIIPENCVVEPMSIPSQCKVINNVPKEIKVMDDKTFEYDYKPDGIHLTHLLRTKKRIVIPDSVIKIKETCFYNKSGMESIEFSSNIKEIEKDAFEKCEGLINVYFNGTIEDWCKIRFSNPTSNPMSFAKHYYLKNEKLEWEEVTHLDLSMLESEIGKYVFYGFENVTKLTMTNHIEYVEDQAFENLLKLSDVFFDGSIEDWCRISFSTSTSNPMSQANNFFLKNAEMKWEKKEQILIPETIKEIGRYQFFGFKKVNFFLLLQGIRTIGDEAFSHCSSISEMCLPNTLESLGIGAFSDCTSLMNIQLPESLLEIPDRAFSNCKKLEGISKAGKLLDIGNEAFRECIALHNFSTERGADKIRKYAFYNCKALNKMDLSRVKLLGEHCFEKSGLESIKLVIGLERIPENAFYQCKKLKSAIIASSIVKIESSAFKETKLKSVEVNEKCQIGVWSFPDDCKVNKNLTYKKRSMQEIAEERKTKKEAALAYEKSKQEEENFQKKINSLSTEQAYYEQAEKFSSEGNKTMAFEYYLKSAQLGYNKAKNKVGQYYELGLGVTKDLDKALYWYSQAGEYGKTRLNILAQSGHRPKANYIPSNAAAPSKSNKNLSKEQWYFEGNKYFDGGSLPKNYKKAVEYYQNGAQAGDRYSQERLGYCYETGKGLPIDLSKALLWYTKAANQGLNIAKDAVARLEQQCVEIAPDVRNEAFENLKETSNGNPNISISTFIQMVQQRMSAKPYPMNRIGVSSKRVSTDGLDVVFTLNMTDQELVYALGGKKEYIKEMGLYKDATGIDVFNKEQMEGLNSTLRKFVNLNENFEKDWIRDENLDIIKEEIKNITLTIWNSVNVIHQEMNSARRITKINFKYSLPTH